MPQATGLVAELQHAFPNEKVDTKIVKGDNGAFEIALDGVPLFSKFKEKRFPRYQEIPTLIIERLAQA